MERKQGMLHKMFKVKFQLGDYLEDIIMTDCINELEAIQKTKELLGSIGKLEILSVEKI